MRSTIFVLLFFVLAGVCFVDAAQAEIAMVDDVGSINFEFSAGSIASMLALIFVFMIVGRGNGKDKDILSEDDKELKYMEKKVRRAEENISRIKNDGQKKIKVDGVKAKSTVNEKELRK